MFITFKNIQSTAKYLWLDWYLSCTADDPWKNRINRHLMLIILVRSLNSKLNVNKIPLGSLSDSFLSYGLVDFDSYDLWKAILRPCFWGNADKLSEITQLFLTVKKSFYPWAADNICKEVTEIYYSWKRRRTMFVCKVFETCTGGDAWK